MTASLLPNGKQQFLDGNGNPLVGGSVYFYVPTTSTLKTTWQNSGQTILNTNPVILDAAGEAIIYGDGTYRQVVYDALGNLIWDQLTSSSGGGSSSSDSVDLGFANFVVPPLVPPDIIYTNGVPSGGLTGYTLPAGQAVLNNQVVSIPQVALTVGANLVTDYYLNPLDSVSPWTITTEPLDTYTLATRYPDLIHVWNIESNATDITSIEMPARIIPVPPQTTDAARVPDQFAGLYVISGTHTNWSSSGAATVGEIILNTTTAPGNLYLVFDAGTLGTVAPTSTGTDTFLNGTATLGYYGQLNYCNNFRYSVGGGIFVYFSNIAAGFISDLQGTDGVYLGETYAKPYFINTFYNLIVPRVNSGTYSFGQKIAAGGYYWISTTITAGAVAGSSPFSGTYSPGALVTDGAVTWKCIQQAYGSPTLAWYWFDTDRTMTVLNLTNAGDSNPTTFFRALWQYIQATNDWTWLTGASPIPSGSGTYYTYAECLGQIFDYNISTLYNDWTPTFQQNIIPTTGAAFAIQYLEDNAESSSGFSAAQNIFFFLQDNTRANTAYTNYNLCSNKIYSLWSNTLGVFPWYLGDDLSWVNNPANQWYPYFQPQLFPELQGVPITPQQKQSARAYVMTNWNNWPQDPGTTPQIPNVSFAYMAAKYWQDTDKARSLISIVENKFLQDGLFINKGHELLVSDFAYYLQTKKILITNNRITRVKGEQLNVVDAQDTMAIVNGVRVVTATYPIIITYLDEIVIINNGTSAAIFTDLYIQTPTDGKKIRIIDGSGNAGTYSNTITPFSGNINGSATFVLNTNYGWVDLVYSATNTKWYAK